VARKSAAGKARARKTASKAKKSARPAAKPAATRAAKKAVTRSKPKPSAIRLRRVVAKKAAKKAVAPKAVKKVPRRVVARKSKAAIADAGKKKHALGLDRERRIVGADDDIVSPTPPSSLNLDRSASSARTGRQELKERYDKHTETSPALTGGDVDADWESAYSVGDEAPGGDNPTPDQNNVDDIGEALGVNYDDNEELEGADKIEERDKHRWEDDPASSEDFEDR
jgi:hypothetical protein